MTIKAAAQRGFNFIMVTTCLFGRMRVAWRRHTGVIDLAIEGDDGFPLIAMAQRNVSEALFAMPMPDHTAAALL